MLVFILEAAIRSLLMALAVWGAIRLLRVHTVLAQKIAWVLVLASAAAMPFVMRVPFLALNQAPVLPLHSLSARLGDTSAPVQASTAVNTNTASTAKAITLPKPSAAHPITETLLSEDALPLAIKDALERNLSSAEDASDSQATASLESAPTVQIAPATTLRKPHSRSSSAKVATSSGSPAKSAGFWNWQRIRTFAIAAYLAIAAILLIRILAGMALAFRIRIRASAAADASLPGHAMDVRATSELSSPVTIGSTVILPADYAEWDEEKLRIVLAHEYSHVRQRDFYLQLAAAVHMAIFWFSPLGWWLQRKLSDLGEALSDRAGLEQASDPAAYAQVLLEFAAKPRTTLAGVAMARSSNLSSRIERILNVRRFRSAFQSSRGHSYLAALLVPASLIAAVALIRVAPAVEAAQVATSARPALTAPVQPEDQVTSVNFGQAAPPAPAAPVLAPVSPDAAPSAPSPVAPPAVEGVVAPEPPDTDVEAPEVPEPARNEIHTRGNGSVYSYSDDDDGSFAIVRGDSNLTISGHNSRKLQKAREKYGNNFIWFERDDKSYVITDPAVLAQSQSLFKNDPRLAERQKALEMRQAELDKQMALLSPEMEKASLPGPEFAAKMAKLNAELSQLQGDKLKKLIDESTAKALQNSKLNQQELQQRIQEQMGEIQERMGEIQGHLGEIQGKIGERQGLIGEKQGELGERMGKLGEEMGKIGEEQGRRAEEDSRKLRSIIDQAYKNGKAKPVE
jgi:beta-lactamase regulating signal transducer with metallopeptidase domain